MRGAHTRNVQLQNCVFGVIFAYVVATAFFVIFGRAMNDFAAAAIAHVIFWVSYLATFAMMTFFLTKFQIGVSNIGGCSNACICVIGDRKTKRAKLAHRDPKRFVPKRFVLEGYQARVH